MNESQKEKKCENCKYFDGYNSCHRHAPQQDKEGHAIWPLVKKDNKCGEFEPKKQE